MASEEIGRTAPTTAEVRETFLDFFMSRGFTHYPDAGILPVQDPTLLFINSGMAPLKPFFTGDTTPPSNRLTNVQNCVRTGDFEDIGDSHHGTSFRMMGSWLLGPAFCKERATELAHELITEGFGLEPARLSASILNGDAEERGIPMDEEARRAWARFLPEGRIIPLPPEDNLWGPPGTSGPCGPCTEVFYDRGKGFEEADDENAPLRKGRHIEIWNAGVFMQYHMSEDGELTPLPQKSVDGGAGLERFAMVLQGAASIHEIDQWKPAYDAIIAELRTVRESRIVLDHIKTAEILMRSGIKPSNRQEGYVLRRLLRRGLSVLHLGGIPLGNMELSRQVVAEQMDDIPGTICVQSEVARVLQTETEAFGKVLARSDKLLQPYAARGEISGAEAHNLHATHGIPPDLIREFCNRHGMIFPEQDYSAAKELHSTKS